MEGNKDEAARCVEIAQSALASGDKQRALKFVRIARRLDHSVHIDALLAACDAVDNPKPPPGEDFQPHPHRTTQEPASSTTSHPSSSDRNYTEDHVRLVREIRKHKDFYAILGVEKSCSVEEIRKAYRKLSLKVHPDKNSAPGADEAFKTVSKAFKCLSDEGSRRQYDQADLIEDYEFQQQNGHMRRRRRRAAGNDFFHDDFDPDEIFRSFFYGAQVDAFRAQQDHRARAMPAQRREHDVQGGGPNYVMWVQLLVAILFFLLAYLPVSEPQYSLQKTYAYQIPRVTEIHGVDYFVESEEFDQKYPEGSPAREKLENDVLKDYKSVLARYCHMELQRRQWVKNYATPHCDKLRAIGVA